MNLLFIGKRHYTHRDALTECYGRIYQLPLHWSQQGVSTHLWLIDYHGKSRVKRDDGSLTIDSTPIRSVSWIIKGLAVFWHRFSGKAPTHIIASGDAYIGLLGWLLARLTGACFVFDVYDKYDEFGAYRKPLGWDLFGFLLRHADQCWFASRRLLGQLGDAARGDALVMNGVDTARFKPMDQKESRAMFGLPEATPLIGYFGGMEADRGVADLISAISLLRDSGLDIDLVLAGKKNPATPIPQEPWLHDLGNVAFRDIPNAYSAVNVFAIPYRRTAFMDAGSSNKIAEAIACGLPIAATNTPNLIDNFPDAEQILSERIAEQENPANLGRVIKKQVESPVFFAMPDQMTYPAIATEILKTLRNMQCKGKQ